jgi:UPF0755 protein
MDDNAHPPGEGEPARASLFARARKPAVPPPPREPKKKRPRRPGLASLSGVLSFVLVGVFVGLAGFVGILVAERKAGPLTEDKTVLLTREDDDGPIADQLEKAGVIENATLFYLMTVLDGQRSALKRGEYAFKAGLSMREVEDMLAHHRVVRHKLSVPEGLTSDQIVQRLRDDELLAGDIKETPREGSLFPDTYVFERGESRQALVDHMGAEQKRIVAEIWQKRSPDLPIKSAGELVTLASIVEKETGKSDERAKVAGVFVNRLQKHMRLQSDPTIVYGLVFGKGTLGHSITKTELQEATPYNTYYIDGLPPGPICNPGRAAMEAVANPARTKDLFFVADGTGGHAFAETIDQHTKNVAHWRQIEKDSKDAKDRVSPDVAPPANIRGENYRDDSTLYGDLGPAAPTTPTATNDTALAAKLTKIASSKRQLDALVGVGGSLSAAKLSVAKSIGEIAVVEGVNDPPPGSDDSMPPSAEAYAGSAAPSGAYAAGSSPLSPAALADLRAREARYGGGGMFVDANVATAAQSPAMATTVLSGRPRAFDASEGTRLDPLLNKTYDLNYPKDVPTAFK